MLQNNDGDVLAVLAVSCRTAILSGGLQAFESLDQVSHLKYINRDAVAFLLAHQARSSGRGSPFYLSPRSRGNSPRKEHPTAQQYGGGQEGPQGARSAVSHDATAGAEGAQQGGPRVHLLDLRRHDERTLYGSIPGSHHLPVDQLASALQLPPDEFQRLYHFTKPLGRDALIMQCRTSRRAAWAAQMCMDVGFER